MADDENRQRWDKTPVLVLAGLAMLLLLGWWLYPRLQHLVSSQDCIATGRTNCS